MKTIICLWCAFAVTATNALGQAQKEPVMKSFDQGEWRFEGEVGRRIEANVTNWLLRAPDANPGMLEILHRRDRRKPYPEHVPWAGEFPGKYLISAVQACRMSTNPELRGYVAAFVEEFIAAQAEDGYLGPWFAHERLLGHWDLWGHYHAILGLLAWHDLTGDEAALVAATRVGDAIAAIFGEGGKRPAEAGTPETNLAVLHGLGELYRRTATQTYLDVMHRIVEDMSRDGDWLELGAKGVPYHELPGSGPRWESIHTVQGLIELHYITGETRYANAARNLWTSLRDFDRHPSGAFSTNERAYGTVYEPGAIETCCSVAWEAFSIDILRLTGDSTVADEIELTTWNQVLGSQHPSGSWWTYNTPIDGVRLPSFHEISFQVRPGTPELNCCSVNAPRGLGMLAEWAVMEQEDAVVVNFYGPGTCSLQRKGGGRVAIAQETDYPVDGDVLLTVDPGQAEHFRLRLRIPAWSKTARVLVNGQPTEGTPQPGQYFDIARLWRPGDQIQLKLDMTPRHWSGEGGRHGHAAIYSGPLLLAFDAYFNTLETTAIPALDLETLHLTPLPALQEERIGHFAPLGRWSCKAEDGTQLILCDFASAGAHGTDYVAWLPLASVPPLPAKLILPQENAVGKPSPVLFSWDTFDLAGPTYTLVIARDPELNEVFYTADLGNTSRITLPQVLPVGDYFWAVHSSAANEAVANAGGPRKFRIDPDAPAPFFSLGTRGLMAGAALHGTGTPYHGVLDHAQALRPGEGRRGEPNGAVTFDGVKSELRYAVPFFPESDYSFVAWVRPGDVATAGFQQVFSAWCRSGDDPLRVTIERGEVSARIEASTGYVRTTGVAATLDEWIHIAAVKQGETLTLYLNGAPAGMTHAAPRVVSGSRHIGVGFNPMLPEGEHFRGSVADFAFYAEALPAEAIRAAFEGAS